MQINMKALHQVKPGKIDSAEIKRVFGHPVFNVEYKRVGRGTDAKIETHFTNLKTGEVHIL